MRRYALRDDQWDRIKDFLPGREGHVGGTAADNRLFVEAVLFRYRAGVPWRDLPERFGDWIVVYQRFKMAAIISLYEPRPRGTVLGERADRRHVGEAEHFSDVWRATVGSMRGIWCGPTTTKARCHTPR